MDFSTIRYHVFCKTYRNGRTAGAETCEVAPGEEKTLSFLDGRCSAALIWEKTDEAGCLRGKLKVSFAEDSGLAVSLGLDVLVKGWSREPYFFMPGAVYNGNRFVSKPLPYPPFYRAAEEEVMTAPQVITDIPHLDAEAPQSHISFLSGDMSTPAMGFFSEQDSRGLLLFGRHIAEDGGRYTGFEVKEDLDAQELQLIHCFPGVREGRKYFFGERADGSGFYPDSHSASTEEGAVFAAGTEWELPFAVYTFPAGGLDEFFRFFHSRRQVLETGEPGDHRVPFSKAYQAVKDKYQEQNYIAEGDGGYFAVGTRRDNPCQCWQAGWIGGGMNNLPFLLEDEGEAFARGLSTFQFILDRLQYDNGWVVGIYIDGRYCGDAFEEDPSGSILLVRKNADLLYFLLKEHRLLKEGKLLRHGDEERIMKLCDAFVRLYKKYGQLGQFIDAAEEKMLVAHTSGAAIAAGALALAYEEFGREEYLQTAVALGGLYGDEYLKKGILNGCPGEICQAPDSEAAFGMLEAYVQLYETTGELRWLVSAQDACDIAMSWVMSYDFRFPEESTASKRGVHSIGTVFANAQNKHSAPGICTLSGNSLLKLYRFTGDRKYLDWLQLIAHSLTQFVSLEEWPEKTLEGPYLPAGYMNERVQTSDWEGSETVGEFLYGSNWPEVSMLLTYVEVPGIYADASGQIVRVFDHISCESAVWDEDGVTLELFNPTDFDAVVTALLDEREDRRGITHNYFCKMEKINIAAGEKRTVSLFFNSDSKKHRFGKV